ncbi:hypothetical protein EFQ99_30300 [Rhizobium vallis]|uniref:Uncharacterized protein n=1 Tax=Rhizobium vallis TaxID=634290 RepID=A0A432PBW7_9HYPH|nr:hypothetical protein [Rhizobium vallis]RUM20046.1 hypothetical protein EFQ99_30300 [Rhizobium vallis]
MSKNDIPPHITLPAVPDSLRNDGWWLAEASGRQGIPAEANPVDMFIPTEKRHLREEQQWIQPIP